MKGYCFTVASFKNGSNDNKASTLDIDDLLETQKQQRLDDLTRLQHHASRRSNRGGKPTPKFRKNVQNPVASGAAHCKPASHHNLYKWTKETPVIKSAQSWSPTPQTKNHNQMQYFSNAMHRDQFRWVRGQDLVKA